MTPMRSAEGREYDHCADHDRGGAGPSRRPRIGGGALFREVAGEFDRPVILFSGGKDSTLLLHLAIKAFWPAPVPFPLLHVDTGHNFDGSCGSGPRRLDTAYG